MRGASGPGGHTAVLLAAALVAGSGCRAEAPRPGEPSREGARGRPASPPSSTDTDAPMVIAHRGASAHAPEHTMPAYERAVEMGADYIEQDLQLTRDGVLVVLHDETLERTIRGPEEPCSGSVRSRTLAELRRCDAGSWFNDTYPDRARPAFEGLRIPTLRQVFERFGHRTRYYIETKSPGSAPGMEEALLAELHRAGLLPAGPDDRRVLIQSFSESSLRRLHELHPPLPLVRLFGRDELPEDADPALAEAARYAVAVGPPRTRVDRRLVEVAGSHDLEVHPWTVNEEAEMRRLVEAGVGGIFTDRPGRLRALLEAR